MRDYDDDGGLPPVATGSGAGAGGPGRPELTLVTKTDCHLCADARAVVALAARELGLDMREQSIDTDPALAQRFAEEVPVVLVDGVPRDFWRIDPVRLRRVLHEAMAGRG